MIEFQNAKVVLLVCHNGNSSDFTAIKSLFNRSGKSLPENLILVDSFAILKSKQFISKTKIKDKILELEGKKDSTEEGDEGEEEKKKKKGAFTLENLAKLLVPQESFTLHVASDDCCALRLILRKALLEMGCEWEEESFANQAAKEISFKSKQVRDSFVKRNGHVRHDILSEFLSPK
eukprot:TRINITY_DN4414_c0_g1_i4.p1 TRINITY_DN4414_c0_g1~~TRINITY_DN4414_c0_g1_i4.p1  ORF type:complete len:177 (-),score=52.55 TRINITY_DN4414_c0_g1_i4:106-636(-)